MSQKKPNIIYILADDQGYGDMSCYNENSVFQTPGFDRLAAAGMRFSDAHASSAVCTPSRYSILTGRYNWRSALKEGVTVGNSCSLIEKERRTVAHLLQSEGYRTYCIGKWHLGWEWPCKDENIPIHQRLDTSTQVPTIAMDQIDFRKPVSGGPVERGFDYYFGIAASLDMPPYVYLENNLPTAVPEREFEGMQGKKMARPGPISPDFEHIDVLPKLTGKALEKIDEAVEADTPFFLYFPLPAPHTPILPTAQWQGKSGTNEYGDFVLMCDDIVSRVMSKLEELGVADNTIVIYTSDNGCSPAADFEELKACGHNPSYVFRGHKADIFEGGHRVPLLISWPEVISPGSVCNELTCLVDFTATVADILNVKLPDNMAEDSVSNLELWQGLKRRTSLREATVHHSINGSFSIRRGRWKLELCPDSGGWSYPRPDRDNVNGLPPIQLYDLESDIGEQKNVYDNHPDIIEELTSIMTRYVKNGRSTPGKAQKNTGPQLWPQLNWMINPE
jgi:arylsulfatase A-like enzyme